MIGHARKAQKVLFALSPVALLPAATTSDGFATSGRFAAFADVSIGSDTAENGPHLASATLSSMANGVPPSLSLRRPKALMTASSATSSTAPSTQVAIPLSRYKHEFIEVSKLGYGTISPHI
jgi:hypothetical protein